MFGHEGLFSAWLYFVFQFQLQLMVKWNCWDTLTGTAMPKATSRHHLAGLGRGERLQYNDEQATVALMILTARITMPTTTKHKAVGVHKNYQIIGINS